MGLLLVFALWLEPATASASLIPQLLGAPQLRDSKPSGNVDPYRYTNDLTVDVELPTILGLPLYIELSESPLFLNSIRIPFVGQKSVPFRLSAGNGERTVHVRLLGLLGIGKAGYDSIELDTTAPTSFAYAPLGVVKEPVVRIEAAVWDGQDRGGRASGVRCTAVIYAKDGEEPQQYNGEFCTETRSVLEFDTSLTGGAGHYAVWTVGIDNAGNLEAWPERPDIEFEVVATRGSVTVSEDPGCERISLTVRK